ncbi:MAG: hypothetical protein QXP31_00710 [Pyrobaculum sp.]
MWLRLCKTRSILDYRPVVFLEEVGPYVEVRSRGGRRAVAKAAAGPCRGVSREIAYLLYPYYGWERMDIEAEFYLEPASPPEATRVVMKVPFGISEQVVRRQLTGYPVYEGAVALEYLEHIEFGEVVHVEPQPFSVVGDNTKFRLVEIPVDHDAVVFMRR